MSWASEIRQTLDMLASVTDPAWQAEYRAKLEQLQAAVAELGAYVREQQAKPKPIKPPKPPKRPRQPDADTVGTVKNIRPQRPFVHDVPPASLPAGHR